MKTNEYLALLYVQSRDLADKKPGDLLVMYKDALRKINLQEGDMYGMSRDTGGRRPYYEAEGRN